MLLLCKKRVKKATNAVQKDIMLYFLCSFFMFLSSLESIIIASETTIPSSSTNREILWSKMCKIRKLVHQGTLLRTELFCESFSTFSCDKTLLEVATFLEFVLLYKPYIKFSSFIAKS